MLLTPSAQQVSVTLSVIAVLRQAAVLVSSPQPTVHQVFAWRQDARRHNDPAAVITRRAQVHPAEPSVRKNQITPDHK